MVLHHISTTACRSPDGNATGRSCSPVSSILSMTTVKECVAEVEGLIDSKDHCSNAFASDSDSDHDSSSIASTIEYEHETFATFQTKVFHIVTAKFPHIVPSRITIEQMRGGSYNRVVGINIAAPLPEKFTLPWFRQLLPRFLGRQKVKAPERFVIRIPRYCSGGMDLNISITKFVEARLSFPVPTITAFDLSDDNKLGKAWILQPRLQGEQLTRLWPTLNLTQKMSAAEQVTKLYRELMHITAPCAGYLVIGSKCSLGSAPAIETFSVPRSNHELRETFAPKSHTFPATPQTPLAHLLEQCERWRELQRADNVCFEHIWNGFSKISNGLHELGFLPDDEPFRLTHNDLLGYNILAKPTSETSVEITGVLDWDMAAFMPSFMFRAPFWLWIEDDDIHGDEETALIEPATEDAKKIKAVFLEGQGSEKPNEPWSRYAFAKECILARRMYPILQHGIFSNSELEEAEEIITEWRELHPFELTMPDVSFWGELISSKVDTEDEVPDDEGVGMSDEEEATGEDEVVAIDTV